MTNHKALQVLEKEAKANVDLLVTICRSHNPVLIPFASKMIDRIAVSPSKQYVLQMAFNDYQGKKDLKLILKIIKTLENPDAKFEVIQTLLLMRTAFNLSSDDVFNSEEFSSLSERKQYQLKTSQWL